MMDNPFQAYLKKARALEEKAKRTGKKDNLTPKESRENTYGGKPYSFPVYWAMHRVRKTYTNREAIAYVILAVPIVFAALFLFLVSLDWPITPFLYRARIITAIALGVWLVYCMRRKILCLATFPFFRNWDKRLSFTVTGWDQLVASDNFTNICSWRTPCSITVMYAKDTEEFRELVRSIFYIFCSRTLPVFEAFESEESDAWGYNGYSLQGRANCTIAGYLYYLVRKDLKKVARITGNIREVAIACSHYEKVYEKTTTSSDSEGTSS
ncbi:MAG: hypothetical protein EPN93_06320 [Spirochaetes bacterium]|nr:MAG: hypothetical protein EPN93_06320 [Spirochaetota bacterium]